MLIFDLSNQLYYEIKVKQFFVKLSPLQYFLRKKKAKKSTGRVSFFFFFFWLEVIFPDAWICSEVDVEKCVA